MSVSVIEGKVIEAPVKVRRKAFVRFSHIDFERADGRTQKVGKVVATGELAHLVTPGAEGRFYMYKTIDVTGVAGVRLADGTSHFAYPGNNLKVFGLIIPMSVALVALRLFTGDGLSLLGVALFILGVVGLIVTRNDRAAAQRQFDADATPSRPSPHTGGATPASAE